MRTRTTLIAALLLVGTGSTALADAPAKDPKTERTWKAKCASCHGDDGKAQTDQGKKQSTADMTTAEFQKQYDDAKLKAAIENGVDETRAGVKKKMDPYKAKLKPDQIDALVVYIRALAAK